MKNFSKKFCAAFAIAALFCAGSVFAAEKPRVVVTVFPIYDWVREIAGKNAGRLDLSVLCGGGTDIHSYQFTAGDMVRLAGADLFIGVGGDSDSKVISAISESVNENMEVVQLLAALGREHHHDEDGGRHDETDDEHVWLSLRDARTLCALIAEKLAGIDPERAQDYRANAAEYDAKLAKLDDEFVTMASSAKFRAVIFADRFPFAALCRDYGLEVFAAFSGCSAESEASFKTIAFLASKLRELDLPALLTIEGSDGRIAETVRRTARRPDCPVLVMNSMQSLAAEDIGRVSYLEVMRGNLEVLRRALN